jgi:beta-glucanase (GH16 family)
MKHKRITQKLLKLRKLSALTVLHLCFTTSIAQTPAQAPATWGQPIPLASDEFNASSVDQSKWSLPTNFTAIQFNPQNAVPDAAYPTGSGQTGALHLKFTANATLPIPDITTNSNPANFKGAMLSSDQRYPYKYGFYEIRAKLPGYLNSNNQAWEEGIIPQFWMAKACWCGYASMPQVGCPLANTDVCNEVDVVEGNGYNNRDFTIDSHWWFSTGQCPPVHEFSGNNLYTPVEIDMMNTFHKYGLELLPNKMVFYFDDQPYAMCTNPAQIPTYSMTVYLDLAYGYKDLAHPGPNGHIDPAAVVSPSPTTSNIDFVLDYFRYYKHNMANCQVDYTITNNVDLANFPPEVRQNVNVGSTPSDIVLMNPNSSQTILFSADFTTICDFEVPLGSELLVKHVACY